MTGNLGDICSGLAWEVELAAHAARAARDAAARAASDAAAGAARDAANGARRKPIFGEPEPSEGDAPPQADAPRTDGSDHGGGEPAAATGEPEAPRPLSQREALALFDARGASV